MGHSPLAACLPFGVSACPLEYGQPPEATIGLIRSASLGSIGSSPIPLAISGLATMRACTSASKAALSPCMFAIRSEAMKLSLQSMSHRQSSSKHEAVPDLKHHLVDVRRACACSCFNKSLTIRQTAASPNLPVLTLAIKCALVQLNADLNSTFDSWYAGCQCIASCIELPRADTPDPRGRHK